MTKTAADEKTKNFRPILDGMVLSGNGYFRIWD